MRPLPGLAAALMLAATTAGAQGGGLPFDVGGPFELIDQRGQPRSEADPAGYGQLLFFGYANCPGICPVAMPMMARAVELLAARGIAVTPVMITVDPDRDRPGAMAAPLARYHPDFVGLTGSEAALQAAYDAYSVERSLAFEDPEYGAVYTHGSFVYLLDATGEVLSVLPPVLTAERVAEVAAGYLQAPD